MSVCTPGMKLTIENKAGESYPLLLRTQNLKILSQAEMNVYESDAYGNLLHDMFEISNPTRTEMPYVLLPSGCPALVFFLRPQHSACYLCGPLTTARKVYVPSNGVLFCVRFKAGSLEWFGVKKTSALADHVIPFDRQYLTTDELIGQLCRKLSFRERCDVIFGFLDQNGAKQYESNPLVQTCMDVILGQQGTGRVHDLTQVVARSERFLSRSFHMTVGLSVKTYCELVKFQNSFRSILGSHPKNLSSGVKSYGYYDLSHMNRAYRRFIHYTASDIRFLTIDDTYVPDLICNTEVKA